MYNSRKLTKGFSYIYAFFYSLVGILSLLYLVYSNGNHQIFYLNLFVGINFMILAIYMFLLLASRDKQYNKFMKISVISKLFSTLDNSKSMMQLFTINHFFISLVASIDFYYEIAIRSTSEWLNVSFYSPLEYVFCILVIFINFVQLVLIKSKLVRTSSSIVFLITYVYVGWMFDWTYLIVGGLNVLLYLIAIKVISRSNLNLLLKTESYRNLLFRILFAFFIMLIGITLIFIVSKG